MSDTPAYQPLERRPIRARGLPIFGQIAAALARRGVSANAISVAGMIAGILAGVCFAATSWWSPGDLMARVLFLEAVAGMQLRLLANLLDGMVALAAGTASSVGELYNDVPDRVSDTAILIGAGYALGGGPDILGYGAALAAMFTAYIRVIGKAAGASQHYCGPMAKQQRMALLTVLAVYAAVMPEAWQPRWDVAAQPGLLSAGLVVIMAGGIVTAGRRLARSAAQLKGPPRAS